MPPFSILTRLERFRLCFFREPVTAAFSLAVLPEEEVVAAGVVGRCAGDEEEDVVVEEYEGGNEEDKEEGKGTHVGRSPACELLEEGEVFWRLEGVVGKGVSSDCACGLSSLAGSSGASRLGAFSLWSEEESDDDDDKEEGGGGGGEDDVGKEG